MKQFNNQEDLEEFILTKCSNITKLLRRENRMLFRLYKSHGMLAIFYPKHLSNEEVEKLASQPYYESEECPFTIIEHNRASIEPESFQEVLEAVDKLVGKVKLVPNQQHVVKVIQKLTLH